MVALLWCGPKCVVCLLEMGERVGVSLALFLFSPTFSAICLFFIFFYVYAGLSWSRSLPRDRSTIILVILPIDGMKLHGNQGCTIPFVFSCDGEVVGDVHWFRSLVGITSVIYLSHDGEGNGSVARFVILCVLSGYRVDPLQQSKS